MAPGEQGSSDDRTDRQGAVALTVRWYPAAQAARMLGISEVAVRRQIADRTLTAIRTGRTWKVLLPAESPAAGIAVTRPHDDQQLESVQVLARTSEALTGLVHDLQRQSLALAGQIGYLQSQLLEAQNQVKQLTDARQTTVDLAPTFTRTGDETGTSPIEGVKRDAEHRQDTIAVQERDRRRRWWHFGRRT